MATRVQFTIQGPTLPYSAADEAKIAALVKLCTDNAWPFTSKGLQVQGVKRVEFTIKGPALPYSVADEAKLDALAKLCAANGWPFTSTSVQDGGGKGKLWVVGGILVAGLGYLAWK